MASLLCTVVEKILKNICVIIFFRWEGSTKRQATKYIIYKEGFTLISMHSIERDYFRGCHECSETRGKTIVQKKKVYVVCYVLLKIPHT